MPCGVTAIKRCYLKGDNYVFEDQIKWESGKEERGNQIGCGSQERGNKMAVCTRANHVIKILAELSLKTG